MIGMDHPTYFIAEIGANFDGNLDKAKRLIDAAKEAGADCAKFQTFSTPSIVSEGGFSRMQLKVYQSHCHIFLECAEQLFYFIGLGNGEVLLELLVLQ